VKTVCVGIALPGWERACGSRTEVEALDGGGGGTTLIMVA